ncbi:MAG TPA: hypothetical protein VFP70_15045 [Burkholderiales bacterium]|nr:hypothetical protein [Burkholderiales bacterium]
MTEDDTLKIFTNLDRQAIEAKLRDLRFQAGSRGLREVSGLLEDVDGKDKDELEAILGACVEIIRPLQGSQRLVAEFEMLQLNLVNLR